MKRLAVIESGAGVGGAELNFIRLFPLLQSNGWESIVLVPTPGQLTKALSSSGIRWREFPSQSFRSTSRYDGPHKRFDLPATCLDTAAIVRQAHATARILREEQITLVHTNSIPSHLFGGMAARLAGVPCVWHLQDIVSRKSGLGLFLPTLNLFAQTCASKIACISRAVARQLSLATLRSRIHIIYNGVNTSVFCPDGDRSLRAKWLGADFRMLIGQVGRLTPWKGQENVLSLASMARDERLPIRFIIAGDDAFGLPGYAESLAQSIRQMGLTDRVVLTGWLDDMPTFYRSIDMLVHPVQHPEPFGLAVAEAMACAKPVAIFDEGGASEVLSSPEYGFRVPTNDVPALWQAVKQIYEQPPLAAQLGAKARQHIMADFGFDRFSSALLQLYESAVSQ